MTSDPRKDSWEESYSRKENFVFFPDPQLIRFFARNLRKQVGDDEFVDVLKLNQPVRMLDLGCGAGRNLLVGQQFGFEMFGLDLSGTALVEAGARLERAGFAEALTRIVEGSAMSLPWPNNQFDCVISDSALDSMPFDIASRAVTECHRVLQPGGLLWFNVIASGPDWFREEWGEEVVVETPHEEGTIQGFFSKPKIDALLNDRFSVLGLEGQLSQNEDGDFLRGRIYVTAVKR